MKRAGARIAMAVLSTCLAVATMGGVLARPAFADVTIAGPVTGGNGSPAAVTTTFDLGSVGYEQSEFFLSGTAHAYAPTAPLASDGRWNVAPSVEAPFTTRIIVNRPMDPRHFNGTVFVEWLNVSIGTDVGVDWGFGHNELIRRGFAWVGVTAQAVGLNAAKAADPARYGPLSHPGDSFSYDMFTQAGQALRTNPDALLGGLTPRRLIASGESQSAGRMVTYIDAIHPLVHTFDGFLVHSRGAGGAPLAQSPQPPVAMPATAIIRTDNPAPTVVLQSETDVNQGARQADSPTFRLWEMAGTSHVDAYSVGIGLSDVGDGQGEIAMLHAMVDPPGFGCAVPINTGPSHWIVQTAMRRLAQWVKLGTAPPTAPRIEVTTFTPRTYARDPNGNVLGGIRTPHVDAPVAVIGNDGQSGPGLLCRLVGATVPFDAAKLASLYRSHDQFVTRWRRATNRAVHAGFLLGVDARLLNRAAAGSAIPS
jgi:Alpha/beta hydrolase domain